MTDDQRRTLDALAITAILEELAILPELTERDGSTTAIAAIILRNWSREKIERFARHLLGEEE
jgi:uncharacterized protein YjgD (DUF1641 family)